MGMASMPTIPTEEVELDGTGSTVDPRRIRLAGGAFAGTGACEDFDFDIDFDGADAGAGELPALELPLGVGAVFFG